VFPPQFDFLIYRQIFAWRVFTDRPFSLSAFRVKSESFFAFHSLASRIFFVFPA